MELRGLDPSGLKAALVERLEAALASDGGAPSVAANGAATNGAPEQPADAEEVPPAATKGRQVRPELTAASLSAGDCHERRRRRDWSLSCALCTSTSLRPELVLSVPSAAHPATQS